MKLKKQPYEYDDDEFNYKNLTHLFVACCIILSWIYE